MGCAILALIPAASAVAQEWSIEVPAPHTRVVPREALSLYCPSDRAINGCTEFLGAALQCQCRRAGGLWSMTAHARLAAYLYVADSRIERHEQMHIEDMLHQLGSFLADLTQRRFDDIENCKSAAEFETTVFNLRLDLFSKFSNRRLH